MHPPLCFRGWKGVRGKVVHSTIVDYSGVLLKLARAESHIADLDYLIFSYLRRNPYSTVQKIDLESGKAGFEITLNEFPLAAISAVLG